MVEFAPRGVEHADFERPLGDGESRIQVAFGGRRERGSVDSENGVAQSKKRLDRKIVDDAAVDIEAAIDARAGEITNGTADEASSGRTSGPSSRPAAVPTPDPCR